MTERADSIDEILEFAIAREVEACELYTYMAKRMEEAEMSEVCREFANEELEHKAVLELELMKQGFTVRGIDISDYTAEDDEPIGMDYEELLLFAIKKEQLAIDLYMDMANLVQDSESRDILLALADEETAHKLRFVAEHSSLK